MKMLLRKSKGRENTIRVLIERNPHIGGPLQFQPMLFNGQLYNLLSLPPKFWFCLYLALLRPLSTEGGSSLSIYQIGNKEIETEDGQGLGSKFLK